MKRSVATVVFSFFALSLCAPARGQLASTPWPMFRCNVRHTGQGASAGPSSPVIAWTYVTGDNIDSSPSIGSDGTIYFGSWDNRFYALTPAGALQWSYSHNQYLTSSPALNSAGKIIVGTNGAQARVVAFNSNGTVAWSYRTFFSVT